MSLLEGVLWGGAGLWASFIVCEILGVSKNDMIYDIITNSLVISGIVKGLTERPIFGL